MEKYLTSLFDYKVKKHALISALVFFIVDKLIYLMHHDYADSFVNHIRFNYLIALSLLIATSSKDKVDDERSMLIRYSILKSSFSFFVVVFGIMALFSNSFGIQSFSVLTILYCIQGLLLVHIILVLLGNRYNPAWLFKEKTVSKDYNQMVIGLFYWLYFIAALLIGIGFFLKF